MSVPERSKADLQHATHIYAESQWGMDDGRPRYVRRPYALPPPPPPPPPGSRARPPASWVCVLWVRDPLVQV